MEYHIKEDIEVTHLQRYFNENKLNSVSFVYAPKSTYNSQEFPELEVKINLKDLYRAITGYKFHEHLVNPENISSILVNNPDEDNTQFTTVSKSNVNLFEALFDKMPTYSIPNPLDEIIIDVITTEHDRDDFVFSKGGEISSINYDPKKNTFELETQPVNLRIIYVSEEDFKEGFRFGETVDILKDSCPIFGVKKYHNITKNIDPELSRSANEVEWDEDRKGNLEGKIY